MRFVVTGATGFLGGVVARRLAAEGHQVLAPCRFGSETARLGGAHGGVTVLPLRSLGDIGEAVDPLGQEPIDGVLHFAVEYGRDASAAQVVRTNVGSSVALLEWAMGRRVGVFVNADTCFTPDYPYLRAYTLSKKQFVAWGQTLCDADAPTRFVNLVLQHPFGPGDRPGKFVPWIIERCLNDTGPIDLTAGDQEKDFIYAGDVAEACQTVLAHREALPPGATSFEVGRGEALTVRRFVETIHRLCESKATLNFGALPKRPGEPPRSVANIEPLERLGWSPSTTIEQGVRLTVEAARRSMSVVD
ncbi:NAD(P)-dependent oxidoreductase [Botrimarina sp.]|uniref:NAD-dependent epimerase/dehydratase family protein n=1 Tax=Botrimarina sp. TaxID=2795802 RepID=UPI0032EF7284